MEYLVQNWEKILIIYLAFVKFVTVVRDAIDKTPGTDSNIFEKFVTILNKSTGALIFGKRVQ